MTAAALLASVQADGLILTMDPPDTLLLRGDRETRARWLPELRAHKAALLALLTEPRRLWSIRHADGSLASHSFSPPASLSEVCGYYPDALSIEPEPDAPRAEVAP